VPPPLSVVDSDSNPKKITLITGKQRRYKKNRVNSASTMGDSNEFHEVEPGKDQTIHAYPPNWRRILESSKVAFQGYIAAQEGYPGKVKALDEAKEAIQQERTSFKANVENNGAVAEKGAISLSTSSN
jgi:hypothetical protein